MYKIKNLTSRNFCFTDIKKKNIMLKPFEEIEHEFPGAINYGNQLHIEQIKEIKKNKKDNKDNKED